MGFRFDSADRLGWAVGIRAMLVAVSTFLIFDQLWPRQRYVTAVFLGVCAVGLVVSIARRVRLTQQRMDQQLSGLVAEYGNSPSRAAEVAVAGSSMLDRVAATLGATRAERQQQLEYLQTLLDTVTAALVVVKDDGRIELVNRAARSLAGAPVSRLEDMKAVGPHTAGELLALAPGTRQVLDLPDGRQMFVSVSQLSSPRSGRQRMLSLHAIAGELDAVELKAWKDMASVLAHEIMNSLTAISSLSESLSLMLQEGAGAEVAGALESIQRRSLGLLDFVERYRMIMDMPAPRMQPLRVEELLAGIEHLLGPSFRERGVLFTRSVEPPQLTCRADPRLLEQALINLLKNSVEALGGTAQPRIDVAVRQREGLLVMTVADNGRGLPELGEAESAGAESARPEFADTASAGVESARPQFAKAASAGVESARPESADTATAGRNSVPVFTTKAAGSGIGLHLVRKIALSHGGQLEAQRNQPRGSIFTLTLPLTA